MADDSESSLGVGCGSDQTLVGPTCVITCSPRGTAELLERGLKSGGRKLKKMEKRENTGEKRKPEEHVVDNWGNKGKEGDGHKQGNDLHLPLSDSYSFIPLFHHGLEESHRCKEDLKTVEAERFATGSDLLGFIPLLI